MAIFLRSQARQMIAALGVSSLLFSACSDDGPQDPQVEAPDLDCNPVSQGVDCFFPFPSDWARVEEDGTFSLKYSDSAAVTFRSRPLHLSTHSLDGFPIHPPIFATFGEALSDDNLIFHTDDTTQTLNASSTTLVIDAETGAPVAHFAELDATAAAGKQELLQIRLLQALKPGTRYIVAVQGVKNVDGALVERPESFDRIVTDRAHASHAEHAAHWRESIAPVLSDLGVELDQVQLAWDFTTRSDQSARGDLLTMLEATEAWLQTVDIEDVYTYTDSPVTDSDHIASELAIEYQIPLFLTSAEPGATLFRDASGAVTQKGTATATGILRVTTPIFNEEAEPRAIIQFGHGFFGNVGEMRDGFSPGFAHENDYLMAATPWWGFSSDDLSSVVGAISGETERIYDIGDRTLQAFINQYIFTRVLQDYGSEKNLPVHFYGISLGNILGSSAVAVNPEITRAAFSVGGGSLSFIMSRSTSFRPLLLLIEPALRGSLATQKFFALSSLQLERVDPTTWATDLRSTTLHGESVERQVLAQAGIGDPAVPTLAFLVWARSAGIPIADSSTLRFSDDAQVTLPDEDAAAVVFDFKTGEDPMPGHVSRIIDSSNPVHGAPRSSAVGQQQVSFFFDEGVIENFCDGTCDPD